MTKIIPEYRARDELHRTQGPAWLIDPASARILAANTQGTRCLGAAPALPEATPALSRLRDILRGIEPILSSPQPMVFLTPQGEAMLACTIVPVERLDVGLALLVIAEDPGASDGSVDSAAEAMDDAATLRKIARRINEGQRALSSGTMGRGVIEQADAALQSSRKDETQGSAAEPAHGGADTTAGQAKQAHEPAAPPLPAFSLTPISIAKLVHELKTPLSAIAAAAEVMRDERLGEIGNARYRGYIGDIHDGARHALAVIERMLAGATENAPAALSFEPLDISQIAASCVSSMRPLAEKAGVRIETDLSSTLAPLTADATSLRQIILNLLINSVKFARRGDVISVMTAIGSGGSTSITISDTGPGMSGEELSRARGDVPEEDNLMRPRSGGGLGLGLPLVQSLVKANAGSMRIESAIGKGTSVLVTFAKNRIIPV